MNKSTWRCPFSVSVLRKRKWNSVELNSIDVINISMDEPILIKLRDYNKDLLLSQLYHSFHNKWLGDKNKRKGWNLSKLYSQGENNILWYDQKQCVQHPVVGDILRLAHDSHKAGHVDFAKTLGRMDGYQWRSKISNCSIFCATCAVCQQQQDHGGLALNDPAYPELPQRRWGFVSTYFSTHLPITEDVFDSIKTLVDRLYRRVNFIPRKDSDDAPQLAMYFFNSIIQKNGLHDAIICDLDTRLARVWTELFRLCGVS